MLGADPLPEAPLHILAMAREADDEMLTAGSVW